MVGVRRALLTTLFALFGVALLSQMADAKTQVVSVSVSNDRGNHLVVNAGAKWKLRTVVIEQGTVSGAKKTLRWSRIGSAKVDRLGRATVCSTRSLKQGDSIRLKVGSVIVGTSKVSRAVTLSGCGYVPPIAPTSTTPSSTAPPPTLSPPPTTGPPVTIGPAGSSSTTVAPPTTTVAPTTTTVAPTTTTVAPTTTTTVAPTTTTTVAPSTPAPSGLALSAASDTGDSSSDGITKATTIVLEGSAEAGSSVQAYVDGGVSGSACTTNGSGRFACTLGTVTAGTRSLTAKATGVNGESVSSAAYSITVDRTAPTAQWSGWIAELGMNDSMEVSFTISENSTTLTSSSLSLTCSAPGMCSMTNFSQSGRTYTFIFNMINNDANGGVVSLPIGSYSDIAGNANTSAGSYQFQYAANGPRPTFSRDGSTLEIAFNIATYDFTVTDLVVDQGGYRWPGGNGFTNLRNPSGDRKLWFVDMSGWLALVGGSPPGTYVLWVEGVRDSGTTPIGSLDPWEMS